MIVPPFQSQLSVAFRYKEFHTIQPLALCFCRNIITQVSVDLCCHFCRDSFVLSSHNPFNVRRSMSVSELMPRQLFNIFRNMKNYKFHRPLVSTACCLIRWNIIYKTWRIVYTEAVLPTCPSPEYSWGIASVLPKKICSSSSGDGFKKN